MPLLCTQALICISWNYRFVITLDYKKSCFIDIRHLFGQSCLPLQWIQLTLPGTCSMLLWWDLQIPPLPILMLQQTVLIFSLFNQKYTLLRIKCFLGELMLAVFVCSLSKIMCFLLFLFFAFFFAFGPICCLAHYALMESKYNILSYSFSFLLISFFIYWGE